MAFARRGAPRNVKITISLHINDDFVCSLLGFVFSLLHYCSLAVVLLIIGNKDHFSPKHQTEA